ncbi:DUF4367 domain-containing protein, partial [Escherichia coli]|uniref:DUF4367 domain-containing protein n=1 Tax=Escherichia coli TaxID=562 RepID=UPI002076EFC6
SDPGPVFHTIVSIKNDGHYFCRAGGNRPDGLNEPVTVIGCANAKVLKRCILPAPDGGVEKLSKPNLHGVIKKVDLNTNEAEIKIKEGGAVSFIFNEETLYFTVFGGDFIMDDLKKVKNTEAWVWYKNCDSKNKNVAVELLQIYELHQ